MYGNDPRQQIIGAGRPEAATQTWPGPKPEADRARDVNRVLDEMERNVIHLTDVIGTLEERMSVLMSPPAPSPTSNAVGLAPSCEMSQALHRHSYRVGELAARVTDILSRLEV